MAKDLAEIIGHWSAFMIIRVERRVNIKYIFSVPNQPSANCLFRLDSTPRNASLYQPPRRTTTT
jgi:hypothetical protein